MKIYYNEKIIYSQEIDPSDVDKLLSDYLNKKGIKSPDTYWRYVGLDNGRTMVDFGSWSNFFYIDCPVETLFKNDKTRDLQNNKGKQS